MHEGSKRDDLYDNDKTRFCVTAIPDSRRPQAS